MNDFLRTKIRALSFFLIVLVVFVHSYNIDIKINNGMQYSSDGLLFYIEEFFSQGLNRIASPLFFIISGYLFFVNLNGTPADFLRKLKKRVKTLIIPYLLWSLAGIALYWLLQSHPSSEVYFTKTPIRDLNFSGFLNTLILSPVPYQLWYIRDLVMFVLLSPLLYLLIKRLKWFVLITGFVFWIADFNFVIFRSQSFFFYTSGAIMATHYRYFLLSKHQVKSFPIVMVWFILVMTKTVLFCNNMAEPVVLKLMHKAGIISGVLAVNFLFDDIYSRSEIYLAKLKPLLTYSFFVFAAHEPLLTIINKSMLSFTGNHTAGLFLFYFISPVITITICLFTADIIKKYFPAFYSVITGGR